MILTVTLNAAIDKRYEVERLQTGEVNRVSRCTYGAGGKGLNVSKVAVIAKETVTATGFTGGHTGELLEELAGKAGIKTEFVRVQGESRTCINIMDMSSRTQTEFLEGGEPVTPRDVEKLKEKFASLAKQVGVVTISGSVPRGVPESIYVDLISIAKKEGVPVLLDTSGRLLLESISAGPSLIKPNQDEICQLTGCPVTDEDELIEAGRKLQKNNIPYVVISLGSDGSLMIGQEGIWRAKVPKIAAVNTVGCGDAMMAGFAVAMQKGLTEPEMLRFASAISAANALRVETGYFEQKDFEEIYPQITIEDRRKLK